MKIELDLTGVSPGAARRAQNAMRESLQRDLEGLRTVIAIAPGDIDKQEPRLKPWAEGLVRALDQLDAQSWGADLHEEQLPKREQP